jgi:hypothetical protein
LFGLTVLPARMVFAESLVVIMNDGWGDFAVLQSRVHEIWARFFGSSLGMTLRYSPSDCFETYPFLNCSSEHLEALGGTYFGHRKATMERFGAGLTAVYNWFHDPNSEVSEIQRLRDLQDTIDRAVLDAYGWTDIQADCEFIAELDEDIEEDESERTRKRKYRYRWPDEIRDEVLARLLQLNRKRALEEVQIAPGEPTNKNNKKPRAKKTKQDPNSELFGSDQEEA